MSAMTSKGFPAEQHSGQGRPSSEHTCSVCLELFTEPKVLPCCHTFCLECLNKTARGRDQVTCPKCRKAHQIPAGGLDALLTDFIAAHAVEAARLSKNTKTQVCGECGQSCTISHFCSNCQKYLCRVCGLELHKRLKIYEGHKVCPIAEVDAATLQSCKVHYCAQHKGEVLKLYCEDCEKLICRDCTLVEHRQHNFKFAAEARENVGKVMKSLKSDVEKKFTVLKHNLQGIKTVETAAVAHPQTLKANINSFFDNLVRSIEARRNALLREAEGVCEKDLKQIWADKEFHEVGIGHVSAVFSLVDKALKCTNDSEMILTALRGITQLRLLEEGKWDGCDFTSVVVLTPKFNSGEKLAVATVGSIDCEVVQSKGLHVLNASNSAYLNSNYVLVISVDQALVDGRSGATISLQQATPPTLNVVVKYGLAQKKLDSAHITVTSIARESHIGAGQSSSAQSPTASAEETGNSHGHSSDSKYQVVVKPVCGGKHTLTIEVFGKRTTSHSFTVSGKPSNGARVRMGPDWSLVVTEIVGTVYYQQNYDLYYGGAEYGNDVIPVTNNTGYNINQYSWGRGERYEVELA